MKLKVKLMFAPGIGAAAMLLAVACAAWMLWDTQAQLNSAREAALRQQAAFAQVQNNLARLSAGLYRTVAIIASLDEAAVKAARRQLAGQVAEVAGMLATLEKEASGAEMGGIMTATRGHVTRFGQKADVAVDMASIDPNTGVAALQGSDEEFAKATSAMNQAGVLQAQALHEQAEAAVAVVRQHVAMLLALAAVGMGLSFMAAWKLQRAAVDDLHRASESAQRVAGGDLLDSPHSERSDEIGDLLRAQGEMVEQLRSVVSQVRDSAHSIQRASSEVAAGSFDLSNRTVQTAANLQQAASSMEQLTNTVRSSADAAEKANALATSACDVASRGGEVVAQVVSMMNEINASSRKIADIIGVIDGIAFQTNILALNAAVEAARAGEQGRGFAVVAAEVRSLAHRSANAAREIKTLIGSSVNRVQAGTRLVSDAGSTMSEIVLSVRQVSDIIGQITTAASEQSVGIEQLNQSVAQLDQMTQQNAALVEESAAAAESLKSHSGTLSQVVVGFQCGDEGAGGMASASSPAGGGARERAMAALNRARNSAAVAVPAAATAALVADDAPVEAPAPALAGATQHDGWEEF